MMKRRKIVLYFLLLLSVIHSNIASAWVIDGINNFEQIVKEKNISINVENKTIEDILSRISKQTNLNYGYQSNSNIDVTKKFSLKVSNVTVEEALNTLFKNSDYAYKLIADKIVVYTNPKNQVKQTTNNTKVTVKGKVIDEDEKPIGGVTLIVEGTRDGAISDEKGQFILYVKVGSVLDISFLGMQNMKYTATKTVDNLVLKMKNDALAVEDVVVTGIFNKSRESYTGAVTTISEKELKMYKGQNLLATLRNIDPSINIIEDNGRGSDPNRNVVMNIRGTSSLPTSMISGITAGVEAELNTPLIIMDGFEISLTKLMDFNDEEIKSINILKDASATAIYGSRGANGVIVIITKTPQQGKLKLSLQATMNIEAPDLSSYNLMNAAEKLEIERQCGFFGDINNTTGYNENLQKLYNYRLKEVLEGVDTYWLSQPLRTGIGQNYNLKLEGGSSEFRWGVNAGYNNIAGVMKDSKRDNFNGSINLSYNFKNLIFRNQMTIGLNKSVDSPYGSFSSYVNMNPGWRIYDKDGNLIKNYQLTTGATLTPNPLYDAQLNTKDETKYTNITNNFAIEWQIIESLRLNVRFGLSKQNNTTDNFKPADHTSFSSVSNNAADAFFNKGSYSFSFGDNYSYDLTTTFSYSKTFNERHQLYAGFDYSMGENSSYRYNVSAQGFPDEDLDFFGNALQYPKNGKPSGSESTSRRVGFTGNINYTFDNRYYIDASMRTDGSSQFGSLNRFAPFWSVGMGWNLHKELFLKNQQFINSLRLKASYGQTGSQQFSSYQALATLSYYTDDKYINWGGSQLRGHSNPNLKWQITDQMNTGLEGAFFNNRFTFGVDVYRKETANLLSDMETPLSTGFSSYKDNIGAVKNTGFELSLGATVFRNKARDVSFRVNAKLSYTKNEITKLSQSLIDRNEAILNSNTEITRMFFVGRSQNSLYAVRSLGIDPSSGNEIFYDRDGVITNEWQGNAKVYMGENQPKFRGNASAIVMVKNFTLNMSFGYHWGGVLYNQTILDKVEIPRTDIQTKNVDRRVATDRWAKPGDIAKFKRLYTDGAVAGLSRTQASSRFVMDDKVFSLQSASIQYQFASKRLTKVTSLQSITIGANMSDLFYISSVKRERGLSYPFSRKISASLSIMF